MKNIILAIIIPFIFFGLLSYYGYAKFDTYEQARFWTNSYLIGEAAIQCMLWLLIIFSCNPHPITRTVLWLMFSTMALRLIVIITQSFTSWYTVTTSRIPLALWAITMVTICILLLIPKKQ